MEQHAVPQEISSYQFHLVGDMTLKQFLELAGGVLVGVIIYALPIIGIIKWPLILFSAGAGAALAFIPFEERPLEQWVFAFFRSIYSPTIFNWDNAVKQEVFGSEDQTQTQTAPTKTVFPNKLEEAEVSFLSKVSKLFTPSLTTVETIAPTPATPPTAAPMQTTPQTQIPQQIGGGVKPLVSDVKVEVPATTPVYVQTQPMRKEEQAVNTGASQVPMQTGQVSQTMVASQQTQAAPAQFSNAAAGPIPTNIPNTIIGQVLDTTGKIIEGAILEIRDSAGRPVRALKTNKAGHFLSVTPLASGKYQLLVEKEGINFDPIGFDATGGVIQPIIIHGK